MKNMKPFSQIGLRMKNVPGYPEYRARTLGLPLGSAIYSST